MIEKFYNDASDASFVGDSPPQITEHIESLLKQLIENQLNQTTPQHKEKILAITKLALRKDILSGSATGIVIAGFGSEELFPTLISFEMDGMVGDKLKFVRKNFIDIDRDGERARVIPFAQKEMVDRFLYGLDDSIERSITTFCRRTAPDIRKALLERLEFSEPGDRKNFDEAAAAAEDAFIAGLGKEAFAQIRKQAQSAVDGMVEFMPKPELAKMAEALVNLTSIKKRVTRGMDTVGGPIDVAVISQAEGFVWVKRKHYFPIDLNQRYVQRVNDQIRQDQELIHAENTSRPGRPRTGPRRKTSQKAEPKRGDSGGTSEGYRDNPEADRPSDQGNHQGESSRSA